MNSEQQLVQLLESCVEPSPKPAVYLSGGLDSSILLFHLRRKMPTEEIHTFTFTFPEGFGNVSEFEKAKKVADHFKAIHHEVLIEKLLDRFPHILKIFDKPQFNIWTYWLAEAAFKLDRQTCYVAEGLDEHFGGYAGRKGSYCELWSNHFQFCKPSYQTVHDHFGLDLEMPFSDPPLDFRKTLAFWDASGHKTFLRAAYKGLLPDFMVEQPKNAGKPSFLWIWENELKYKMPMTVDELRGKLQKFVALTWGSVH
jgi:hypothetical protein